MAKRTSMGRRTMILKPSKGPLLQYQPQPIRSWRYSGPGVTTLTRSLSRALVQATYRRRRSVSYTPSSSASSAASTTRSSNGSMPSSQAITATARNSSPWARCLFAIVILVLFELSDTAARARSTNPGVRTKMPISSDLIPSLNAASRKSLTAFLSSPLPQRYLSQGPGPQKSKRCRTVHPSSHQHRANEAAGGGQQQCKFAERFDNKPSTLKICPAYPRQETSNYTGAGKFSVPNHL